MVIPLDLDCPGLVQEMLRGGVEITYSGNLYLGLSINGRTIRETEQELQARNNPSRNIGVKIGFLIFLLLITYTGAKRAAKRS